MRLLVTLSKKRSDEGLDIDDKLEKPSVQNINGQNGCGMDGR